jgi:polyisoprenoid-binding protein YceI
MNKWILISALALVAGSAFAQNKTFTVGKEGRDARQLATVESVSDFETFTGRTAVIRGRLNFNPQTRTGGGTLTVNMASVDTGIPLRNDHMKSAGWLDTEKFPNATFEATQVTHRGGDNYRVTGKFTMKGVTRTVSVNARVRYRAESDATRKAGFEGDVLQLTTSFKIKLSDYNVTIPPQAQGKVANEVTISITAFGVTG